MNKEETKAAYKKAVVLNNFKPKILSFLHKRSINAIEKYLYTEGRYPDFQCAYELYWLIKNIKGVMPSELSRIINRSHHRTQDTAKKIGLNEREKFVLVGEKFEKKTYILNGEIVSIKEICKKLSISHSLAYTRLSKEKSGNDISHIDFTKHKRGKKRDNSKMSPQP
jgi:hypothetical protein